MAVAFELVSPEALVMADDVDMVVVPGEAGDFGVLPGHSPTVSTVRPGVVHVFKDSAVSARVFVAGGFAEVTTERCTVLTEEAVAVDDIDKAAVEAEIRDLGEDVGVAADDAARERAEERLTIAQAKLVAATELLYN